MLRILQHVKAYRTSHGGIERVVEELVPRLNRYPDLEVDVLCQGAETREYALTGGGRVNQARTSFTLSGAGLSWGDFRYWSRAARQYDVVHVHLPWPQSNLNFLLQRFSGAAVVHWHSDIVRQRSLYALYKPVERWLLERADKICVTSPKLLDESPSLDGFRHKAVAIPIGVSESDADISRQDIEAVRALYPDQFVIFALGRMVSYKGFEYLVRAAPLLVPRCVVVIAGDGPLRQKIEALIHQCNVEHQVKLLGRLSNREVELYMRGCDVFCLPSVERSEAFGIVQIEAMRASRPVVSTRIQGSGVNWVNQDGVTGFTVERYDPAALAEALNRLAVAPELMRRFGDNARVRYEEMFTAQGMAERVRQLYLS